MSKIFITATAVALLFAPASFAVPSSDWLAGATSPNIVLAKTNSMKASTGGKNGGVGCHGAKNCANMIESVGDQCKSFRCNKELDGKPSCWCDT